MRNQTFTTRRENLNTVSYGRNQNIVRHNVRGLGPIAQVVIIGLLVVILGLFYVMQGTRATTYDYQLSEIETEIAELESKKEDLAVEQARLTSIAATENSEVAMSMANAQPAGYAQD